MKRTLTRLGSALLLAATVPALQAFDLGSVANAAAKATGSQQQESGLVQQLTSQLGVTPTQASGGVAALLGQAKGKMKPNDFSKLTSSVPELGSLMNTAGLPSAQGLSLNKQFSALGLDSGMIAQFTPIVLQYVKPLAGPEVTNLLAMALR
jgi:hypothetical protein